MHTDTGKLVTEEALKEMGAPARRRYVLMKRDLTKKEALNMEIKLYSPCGCGSGKKFKFCCKTKPKSKR